MVFFLIGAPYKGNSDAVWNDIQKHVLQSGISQTAKGKQLAAEVNRFKLGNLDQLMFINDQLIKQDAAIESLLKKVERQYLDITEKNSVDFVIESREGAQSVINYIMGFKWDDSRFARNTPLVELIKAI
jgi:V-type H+-transporting ATPase subunit C